MTHLTDAQIQGLADGTLRGPEGLAARDHIDACPACAAEHQLYAALASQLSALSDPAVPAEFTAEVMGAVEVREAHLAQRRHTALAAMSACALAVFSIVGWALSSAPAAHVDRVIEGASLMRTVFGVVAPVVSAVRVPLALSTLAFVVTIALVLARTLRSSEPSTAA